MNVNNAIHTLGAVIEGLKQDPTGTTVSVRARKPLPVIDGYVVGGGFRELRLSAGENIFAVPEDWGSFTGWLRDLPEDTTHVGVWLDEGEYVFDSVTIYQNLDVALKIAAERDEEAIYDGYRLRVLSVAEPQY